MNSQVIAKMLFVVWLALFASSFIMFMLTPSKDFGFTAGANRIVVFFGWQIAAGFVGFALWIISRNLEVSTLWRWLCRAPAMIAALLFFMVLFLIIGAIVGKSPPQDNVAPDGRPTTTAPPVTENPPNDP